MCVCAYLFHTLARVCIHIQILHTKPNNTEKRFLLSCYLFPIHMFTIWEKRLTHFSVCCVHIFSLRTFGSRLKTAVSYACSPHKTFAQKYSKPNGDSHAIYDMIESEQQKKNNNEYIHICSVRAPDMRATIQRRTTESERKLNIMYIIH